MVVTELDIQRAYEAQQLAQAHRGWLVMWAPWRRTLTAFSCFAAEPLVIEAPTPEQLDAQLRQVELRYGLAPANQPDGYAYPLR